MNSTMNASDECAICYRKMVLPLTLTCNHSFCFLCIKGVHETMTPPLCPMCREDISSNLFKKPKQIGRIDMKDPEDPKSPMRSAPGTSASTSVVVKQEVKQEPGEPGSHVQLTRDAQGNILAQTSSTPVVKPDPDEKKSFWLYQSGRDKWWRFDPRCEKDLDAKMEASQRQFDMIICGHSYRIDLDRMVQERLDRLGGQPVGGRNRDILRVESVDELKSLDVRGIAGVQLTRR
ncbi:hypothetical protein PMAYCL1PPCAC_25941 [Pristionchus mayeri]|uniref:E3 ubiquitin-protein ligase n=1 Tax=Pristionchus mayeri TaxID=1317129 RepID=A0AAN5D2M9_9BILA|nr:hypothetical protein PMAYCL1PPCAC_25941 [Pristionchus mayeri]